MVDLLAWWRRLLAERRKPERFTAPGPHEVDQLRRKRLCEWVRANGLDPDDIPADAEFVIHDGQITVDVVVRDADGNTIPSSSARNSVMKTKRTVPLLVPFPKEWT
ncbi:hypothetical protein JNW88_00375 [Micromonospora sp. ATA32]|nr:hypothetical protein [Micromonospora sp. ATA32]